MYIFKKYQRQRITINLLKSKDYFTALQFLYNLVSHPAWFGGFLGVLDGWGLLLRRAKQAASERTASFARLFANQSKMKLIIVTHSFRDPQGLPPFSHPHPLFFHPPECVCVCLLPLFSAFLGWFFFVVRGKSC